jgi:ribokinase
MTASLPNVTVVGSVNMDSSYSFQHLPAPGETPRLNARVVGLGGKGTNQAVAAAHAGALAIFSGAVGDDSEGIRLASGCGPRE